MMGQGLAPRLFMICWNVCIHQCIVTCDIYHVETAVGIHVTYLHNMNCSKVGKVMVIICE